MFDLAVRADFAKWSKSIDKSSTMCDIELAKNLLDGHSVVCVCGQQKIISDARGISPLLEMIRQGTTLCGYAVADKIIGKAAAFLFCLLEPKEVYAKVLSAEGEAVFRRFGIPYAYGERTEHIINRSGSDICPMEKTVAGIDDPQAALAALRAAAEKLRAAESKG